MNNNENHDGDSNKQNSVPSNPKKEFHVGTLADEEFREIQKRFADATPEERKEIADIFISAMYDDLRNFLRCRDNRAAVRATSIVNGYYLRLVKKYLEPNADISKFAGLEHYYNSTIVSVYNFFKDHSTIGLLLGDIANSDIDDPDASPVLDVEDVRGTVSPEEYIDILNDIGSVNDKSLPIDERLDSIGRIIAAKVIDTVNKVLSEDEKELLRMRYGNGIFMSTIINGEPNEVTKYAEIAKKLGHKITPDGVRMRINAIIERLKETPAVIVLMKYFGVNVQ